MDALPFHFHNVRVMIVSGTRTRNPDPSEHDEIRAVLEEIVRLDGHIRDGTRWIRGIGHARWRQATDRPPSAPPEESGRYIVLNVIVGNTFKEIRWKGVFSDSEAAIHAFTGIVAENRRPLGAYSEVYAIDRIDGRVLRSTGGAEPYSPAAARWLRIAEDEIRNGRSSSP